MKEKGQIQIVVIIIFLIILVFIFYRGGFSGNNPPPQTQVTATPTAKYIYKSGVAPSIKTPIPSPTPPQPTPTPDTIPPLRSNPQPRGTFPSNTLKIILSLDTNEISNCRYSIYENVSYDAMFNFFQKTNSTSHSAEITTLSPGKEFNFYVKCVDKAGNKNTDDLKISFNISTEKDTTPPDRRYLSPYGLLPAGTTHTTLTITTDESASCSYSKYQGKDFWSGAGGFSSDEHRTYHTAEVWGLENGKTYDFYVRCTDTSGNTNEGDILIRFQIDQ